MKIAIFGAKGRMGQALLNELKNYDDLELVYAFSRENNDYDALFKAELIIDFSLPDISYELLQKASKEKNPPALVVGTTGLKDDYFKLANEYKGRFFWASNTSLGIAIVNELTKIAAAALKDFDIEIHEMHHIKKADAPSGTALTLAKSAQSAKSKACNKDYELCFNREGLRKDNEIGISVSRGGNVAGYHCVGFYGDDECVKIEHNANSRAIFAKGALKIARWLSTKEAKNYTMADFVKELIKA